MRFLEALGMALSTYSILPVPQFRWREETLRWTLCFFPVVGLFCGGVLLLWWELSGLLRVGALLFAVGAVGLPLLLTGGIHMDGFMDTVDALASHQTRERKLDILKDPHCGAFAVLFCGVYLLFAVGLMAECYPSLTLPRTIALALLFVLSRALSAVCAVTLPPARPGGMLRAMTGQGRRVVAGSMVVLALLVAGGVVALAPVPGGVALALAVLTLLWYRRVVQRHFGGVTGDTAGFFLQTCELMLILGFWLGIVLEGGLS